MDKEKERPQNVESMSRKRTNGRRKLSGCVSQIDSQNEGKGLKGRTLMSR